MNDTQVSTLDELEANGTPQPAPQEDAYFRDFTAVSHSMLRDFRRSRAKYHALYVAKSLLPDPPSKEMLFGKAFHMLVLEPEEFAKRYVVSKKIDKRTKAGKEEYAAWCQANVGKLLLDPDDADLMHAMALALTKNTVAQRWLFGDKGLCEQVCRWTCPETGLARKCKGDLIKPEHKLVVDIKTTTDPSPSAWSRTMASYGYHQQAATYLEGAAHEYGPGGWMFLFLAVSKDAAFPQVGAYILPDAAIALAEQDNRKKLAELKTCHETGNWDDDWSVNVTCVDVPRWEYTQFERSTP